MSFDCRALSTLQIKLDMEQLPSAFLGWYMESVSSSPRTSRPSTPSRGPSELRLSRGHAHLPAHQGVLHEATPSPIDPNNPFPANRWIYIHITALDIVYQQLPNPMLVRLRDKLRFVDASCDCRGPGPPTSTIQRKCIN